MVDGQWPTVDHWLSRIEVGGREQQAAQDLYDRLHGVSARNPLLHGPAMSLEDAKRQSEYHSQLHGDGVYSPFSTIPGYLDPAKARQEAATRVADPCPAVAALNPHLVADMNAAAGITPKAADKPIEVKPSKPIDATSLDDYRRGVAKVFDSYRLLP